MERLSAPERTREELRALMNGELGTAAGRGDLVRLALRLIVEEALEGEPPRTAVRRGTAKAENHSQWLRREAGAQAHVRRPHPSRRTMARPALHRVRAPTDRRCQKRTRRRISRFNHPAGPVSPAPSFQQIQALTRADALAGRNAASAVSSPDRQGGAWRTPEREKKRNFKCHQWGELLRTHSFCSN